MRSFVTFTALASVASMVSAIGFEYPETVPALEKRQEPGTPRYACHENCGTLISLGRTEGYCTTSEWATRYAACMACANEFGIWMYYQSGVTNAAKGCGQTPNPAPSGAATTAAAATTSAAAPASSSAPAAEQPSTSAAVTSAAPPASQSSAAAASSSGAAAPATTLTTAASSAASSGATGAATTSAAGSSSATATRVTSIGTSVVIPSGSPTPSVVFAGASKNTGVLGAVGVVGLVLAAL